MKSIEIRQKFFDFFVKNGHTQVASSSLIPSEDPTLLFTNAGMNQFKDTFLGKEKRSYNNAVTIQKCIRAGGKHNDLDNVGRTKRHLTFFEMMGNFSFGGYFKQEAITLAWNFLTLEMKLPAEKLYISIHTSDDEAFTIWNSIIGIPQERIVRLGDKDNFWQMGDTGPCGPCTEIHYDKGAKTPEEAHLKVGDDGERFLEIWNLVFMQFNRQADGTNIPLTQPGVDTGMGIERLASILQNVDSSFDTDIFAGIIQGIERLSQKSYYNSDAETRIAFRVLADHIRSVSCAIADGGIPSNEGRGYVLRKIIRRAALFAQKLGDYMIFPRLVDVCIKEMGDLYPELVTSKEIITSLITHEVEKFSHNLERGQLILAKYLAEHTTTKIIPGNQAFMLYDTYGFPPELINIVAFEKGYTVDTDSFEQHMAHQRLQSNKKNSAEQVLVLDDALETEFTGYDELITESKIVGLIHENRSVDHVAAEQLCWIVPQKSPFYVECGGQVNDQGSVIINKKSAIVQDVAKINNARGLFVKAPHALSIGDSITLVVDQTTRASITKNHTATHLLQAALVKILGNHIKQAGSLVTPNSLRFDFNHHQAITDQEIDDIESMVNAEIMNNTDVTVRNTTYKNALDEGIRAAFGEKYNPEHVRAIEIATFSRELCGGIHVKKTGEIGCFKIINHSAVSTGVRRITAITGIHALNQFQNSFSTIKKIAQEYKVNHDEVWKSFTHQAREHKELINTIKKLKQELIHLKIPNFLQSTMIVNTVPFCYIELDNQDGAELINTAKIVIDKKPGFYFLVSKNNEKTMFFAVWAPEFENSIQPKKFLHFLQSKGLKGGSKPGSIQGGGIIETKNLKDEIVKFLQS